MSREEWLREACAQIAQEEAEKLERSISPSLEQTADALYQRHRRRVFALIKQNSRKEKSRLTPYFRAAACLALAAGAAFMLMHPQTRDALPAVQPPAASVRPYYTAEPSPAPIAAADTSAPTMTFNMTEKQMKIPTDTPKITEKSIEAPTPAPSPTPEPTLTPVPEERVIPADWMGAYFPVEIPEGYALLGSTGEAGVSVAVYADAEGGRITFTEYETERSISIPEDAEMDYIELHGGAALRMVRQDTVLLAWQMEGRTLTLEADACCAMEIAESVERISAE